MRFQKLFPLPFLPLLLVPVILLSPVLFTGKALFWGTPFLQFVPWRYLAWEILRSGQLPLWNPWVGMGAPLAANYQSALFYPPNWSLFILAALGGVRWLAWGQGLLVVLHWIWAAAGMALLARQLGLGKLAQTVSGLAFGLSAYLVARSGFLTINAAAAWTPWIILFVSRLESWKVEGQGNFSNLQPANPSGSSTSEPDLNTVKGRSLLTLPPSNLITWIFLSVSIAMQLLAGHAQTAWYTLLLAGMWAGFLGWTNAIPRILPLSTCIRRMPSTSLPVYDSSALRARAAVFGCLRLGLSLLLALALSAIQLLPTAEYLQQSQRSSAVDYDFAMTYSFWPWRFLTLLAPDLFGNPAHGDYWGYGNYWEDALYIGLLPLLMALAAVISIRTRRSSQSPIINPQSKIILFLSFLCLISIVLALGKNTPLFPWLYRHIPAFDMFQAPTRFSLWAEFALALLAAYGIDLWRRPTGRALYWTRLGTAGAFSVMLGAGLTAYFLGSVSPTIIRATALTGLWGVGVGVLSLLAPVSMGNPDQTPLPLSWRRFGFLGHITPGPPPGEGEPEGVRFRREIWSYAVVILLAADLLLAGSGLNPGVQMDIYADRERTAVEVEMMAAGGRLYLPEEEEYRLKFERFFHFKTFDPGESWGNLRRIWIPNTNLLDRIPSANNFDPLVPGRYARWMEALENADGPALQRMLNLMGVGVVEEVDESSAAGVGFEPVPGSARVRWVSCAHPAADGSGSLGKVLKGELDLNSAVILEGLPEVQARLCQEPGSGREPQRAEIHWIEESPNRLALQVEAGSAGWLVLSDTWYPGWQARVDGDPAQVFRANYLFRAVQVQPGVYEVEFAYRPMSFYLGAFVSFLAWVGVAVCMFVVSRSPSPLKILSDYGSKRRDVSPLGAD